MEPVKIVTTRRQTVAQLTSEALEENFDGCFFAVEHTGGSLEYKIVLTSSYKKLDENFISDIEQYARGYLAALKAYV